MDKLKIMRKLDEILPDKWRISEMDEKCDLVKVVCPIGERYGGKDFEKTKKRQEDNQENNNQENQEGKLE